MQYGICNVNCAPVRKENSDASELITQLLFGDDFRIVENKGSWCRIKITYDFYEGWVDKKQFLQISKEDHKEYTHLSNQFLTDFVDYGVDNANLLFPISLGANLKAAPFLKLKFEGKTITKKVKKSSLLDIASNYLNAPYLWGGKTPFGIDCSGLTQMVYKIAGYQLFRDASQQAKQGEPLSFIEESETGDLAFFDNKDGKITHVGIILPDNYIMHAHGKVRIDRIDHTGIFNQSANAYSHRLRVIKKII